MASKFELSLVIGAALASSFRSNISTAERQLGQLGAAVDELKRADQQLGASSGVKSMIGDLRRAQGRLQTTISARKVNLENREALRGQLTSALAMGAAIGVPVMVSANFEQSMMDLASVANLDRVSDEYNALESTARRLGASTSWSAGQASEGMKYLAMAGMEANEIVSAMPGMLDLATAGEIDLARGADIASNILSGFKMEAQQMGYLGDVLTNTFTTSNTSLSMLGESMKYVAPVASSLGVSVEMAAAMTGKLGDVGIQGSQAGTALRTMLTSLAAPTGESAKALQRLGIETMDAQGNLRDIPTVLADMQAAMSDMGSGEQAAIMKRVFGTEGIAAATELMGKAASGELQKYAAGLTNAGAAADVANKRNDSLKGTLRELGSATESIAITFGGILAPAVRFTGRIMTKTATVLDSLAQEHPVLTKVVVGATAGILGMTAAAIGLGYAFTFIKGGVLNARLAVNTFRAKLALLRATSNVSSLSASCSSLGGVLPTVAAGVKSIGFALFASPIGLVVGAIAGAALLVYKYWGPVKSFFTGVWQGISVAAQPVVDTLAPAFGWLGSVLAPIGNLLRPIWDGIKGIGSALASFFTTADHGASEGARNLGQKIGSAIFKGLKFVFMNFSPIGLILQLGSAIKNAFSGLSLAESGKKLLSTLVDGIKAGAGAVVNALGSVLSKARDLLPFSDAKTGPLSELTVSGAAIPATIGQGIAAAGSGHLVSPLSAAMAEASRVIQAPMGLPPTKLSTLVASSDTAQQPAPSRLSQLVAAADTSQPPASAAGSGAPVTINYSPQISIQGDASRADVDAALVDSEARLKRMIEDVLHNDRRISYV